MPPQQIAGRYDVIREVGRGGMGSVWLCTDQVLGREVAVKQVGGVVGETSPQVARALREARSSAALNHPNVVSIFDAIEDGDRIWLVMEYLPSRTLSQVIEERGALPAAEVARIGAQAANGLAAAHARGTVHRDVKPSNILVTDDGVAKISDFGIARTIGEEQLTQTGLVSGTPLYFSPELARGAEPAAAADVWALGASLYAALEGTSPWPQQENPIAMLVHIANNEPPRPSTAGPLADVISQMLVVDPEQRLPMEVVRERLEAIAAGEALDVTRQMTVAAPVVEAAPPSPVPMPVPVEPGASPTSLGRRRTALALAVAALVIVAGVGLAVVLGSGDDDDPDPAGAAGRGSSTSPSTSPADEGSPAEGSTPEPQSEPSDTPSEPTTDEEPEEPVDEGTADAADFVQDYYALLPSDTKSAWDFLSEEVQAEVGSYGSYQGFWKTVDSVQVGDVETVEDGVVDVSLTYVTGDGSQSETRRLTVEEVDGEARVVDDYVV